LSLRCLYNPARAPCPHGDGYSPLAVPCCVACCSSPPSPACGSSPLTGQLVVTVLPRGDYAFTHTFTHTLHFVDLWNIAFGWSRWVSSSVVVRSAGPLTLFVSVLRLFLDCALVVVVVRRYPLCCAALRCNWWLRCSSILLFGCYTPLLVWTFVWFTGWLPGFCIARLLPLATTACLRFVSRCHAVCCLRLLLTVRSFGCWTILFAVPPVFSPRLVGTIC